MKINVSVSGSICRRYIFEENYPFYPGVQIYLFRVGKRLFFGILNITSVSIFFSVYSFFVYLWFLIFLFVEWVLVYFVVIFYHGICVLKFI